MLLHTTYSVHWFARLFLAFTGAGILSVFMFYLAGQPRRSGLLYLMVVLAFLSVFVAEVVARYLFYAGTRPC